METGKINYEHTKKWQEVASQQKINITNYSMNLSFQQLSKNEQDILNLYKGNSPYENEHFFADHINKRLRENATLEGNWKNAMETLDSLFEKMTSECEHTLYRATVDSFVQPYLNGAIYNYPAYMSTAKELAATPRHFANNHRQPVAALLEIHCPAGTPAINLEINHSYGGLEQEVLLPRNSKFMVRSVDEVTNINEMCQYMPLNYGSTYNMLRIYELYCI